MPIKVVCRCGQAFAAKDEWAGKTLKCPKCQSALAVPQAAPAANPASPLVDPQALHDLLDQEGFSSHVGVRCPKCNEPIPPGGILCVSCGQNIQTGMAVASNVRKQAKNPGHGEVAESILSRAVEELKKAPPVKDETAGGMVMSYMLTLGMLVLVAGGAATGYFLFRMMEGAANKTYASGQAMTWIGLGLGGLGLVWIVIVGMIDNVVTGLLCLIPFYQFYYGIVKGYRFQLFLIVLGTIMVATGLGLMSFGNSPDPTKPVGS